MGELLQGPVMDQLPPEEAQRFNAMQPPDVPGGRWRQIAGRAGAALALAASAVLATEASPTALAQASSVSAEAPTHVGQDNYPWNSAVDNWVGYGVSTPTNFDFIDGDFIVPTVTCPETGNADFSIWVGMGTGTDSDPLYQAGVRLICQDGTETSKVWYEDYSPDGTDNGEHDFTGRTVSAGDKIVVYALPGSNAEVTVYDFGSSLSQPYPNWSADHKFFVSASPSAEQCIVEKVDFFTSGDYDPVPDFGTVDWSTATSGSPNHACDAAANDQDNTISSYSPTINHITGISQYGYLKNTTPTPPDTLATTSNPSLDGEITVTWNAST
jgi:peptidase A4-like protein